MSNDQEEDHNQHPPPQLQSQRPQSNTAIHYSYTPKDDCTKYSYILRGLQSSTELVDSWSPFCAFCFSSKSNPPSQQYFERHYFNDIYGNTNPHLIRIAETTTEDQHSEQPNTTSTNSTTIVSSVRIFQRYIRMNTSSLGNTSMEEENSSSNYRLPNDDTTKHNNTALVVLAGGIGEVCTHPRYRRQGLSNALLQNAIHIMETSKFHNHNNHSDMQGEVEDTTIHTTLASSSTKNRMQVSLLHAAPHFFPVYQKAGYTNVSSKWSLVPLVTSSVIVPTITTTTTTITTTTTTTTTDANKDPLQYHIRTAEFPKDTQQLQTLHSQYSEQRLWGCIVRSTSYWNTYLSQEFKNTGDTMSPLFVLETATKSTKEERSPPKIVAWLSLRYFSHADKLQFQIREFGRQMSKNNNVDGSDSISTMEALSKLVSHAIRSILVESTTSDDDGNDTTTPPKRMELRLPTFVLEEVLQEQKQQHSSNDDDLRSRFLLFDWSGPTIQSDNDEGWMYRLLVPHEKEQEEAQGTTTRASVSSLDFSKSLERSSVSNPHFIWPSDSF